MKIRKPTPEHYPKAASLLDHAFAPSRYEVQLFDKLHEHNRTMHEWVCLVRDSVVAYIGFTNAYNEKKIVGLHLGPWRCNHRCKSRESDLNYCDLL